MYACSGKQSTKIMKKDENKPLTERSSETTLRRMQQELNAISVEPNVEARLDRIFDRVGVLYGGDFRRFFNDLDAANAEPVRECDLKVLPEALARFSDDE
jgi:hypothetical protein